MELIIETFKDTFLIFFILLVMYFGLEYFEHKVHNDYTHYLYTYGPLFGALTGIFPQCGFSVVAALLFIENKLSLGTLISVFIATSDEAIPILLTNPQFYPSLLKILIIKLVLAVIVGYFVDLIFKKQEKIPLPIQPIEDSHQSIINEVFIRTLKVYAFIFITNLILSYFIESIGIQNLSSLLLHNSLFQPLISALFGFIPNCVASVALTQLYMSQTLSFASLISGLITNAGLGILILIKNKLKISIILKICFILLFSALMITIPLQWFYLFG